jgi:tetratricopeptide (TPR) repeat protein
MDRRELLDRYEATGDEGLFLKAKRAYEDALSGERGAGLLLDYGYLLECHARNVLRRAVAQYEHAIELNPGLDKAHYQLIHAHAALFDVDDAIALYRQRLAASPADVRVHRFLAYALVVAHEYRQAGEVIKAGLRVAQDDRKLIEFRGDVRAGLGDRDGGLADWRHAVELDPEDIGPLYSSAFLLERDDRVGEAIAVWQEIIAWNEARGNAMDVERAVRERDRLRGPHTSGS